MPRRQLLHVLFFVLTILTNVAARTRPVDRPQPWLRQLADDPHSWAQPENVVVSHASLDLTVDFTARKLRGSVRLEIDNRTGTTQLDLDTRALTIERITLDGNQPTSFTSLGTDSILGEGIRVLIRSNTRSVTIHYETAADADALSWMTPEQTRDQRANFVYSQNEPISARSWIPIQDTPSIRLSYDATLRVPPGYLALMSAENPTGKRADGIYRFTSYIPMPPYLIAIAVGDLEFRAIDHRSGVYAEPSLVDAAAAELIDVPAMMSAAAAIGGPYQWGRYDVLFMPPTYQLGGMEHPRLTFASPQIIAGDRSLTSLIAHELAHSWSGNLVTTSTWDDIWLNEGLTVYIERRIMEAVYGPSFADMISWYGLQSALSLRNAPPSELDTRLHQNNAGKNPAGAFNGVPYEKGWAFFRMLEENLGRARLDAFLREYFRVLSWSWTDAATFRALLLKNGVTETELAALRVDEWIHSYGIPVNYANIRSTRLEGVQSTINAFVAGTPVTPATIANWTVYEFIYFFRWSPRSTIAANMTQLDALYPFDRTMNRRTRYEWLLHVARNRYSEDHAELEQFLVEGASISWMASLYTVMLDAGDRVLARRIYDRARPTYHQNARDWIDSIFVSYGAKKSAAVYRQAEFERY